jgi:cupin fold WbuC family metalloprotein
MTKLELDSIANKISNEIYVVKDNIAKSNIKIVNELKCIANESLQKKSRLLLHQNKEDSLHQMIIVHSKAQYIRPHKNIFSAKSWQVVEGRLVCLFFSDEGELINYTFMSSLSQGDAFIVRLSESFYHTLIPLTDKTVIVETILGPFNGTTYASWAPAETDIIGADNYLKFYCQQIGIDFNIF